MASEFKGRRAATLEARELLRRQIDKSLECLERRNISEESIHRARKQIKKARAILRLLRPGLSNKQYRDENARLRDAARPLSAARDAAMLRKTFQHIQTGARAAGIRSGLREIDQILASEQSRAHRRVASEVGVPHSRRLLREAQARTSRFHLSKHGWSTIGEGVRRVYRQGRKALQAVTRARSDTAFHEWRKQVKYLRYQVQLLRPIRPGPMDALTRELHSLGDYLGDEHDLVVLRAKLTAPGSPLQGNSGIRALLGKLDHKRAELRRKALKVGAHIFEQPPAPFCSRLRQLWRNWRGSR
jgi:CHAD domain-containing protein